MMDTVRVLHLIWLYLAAATAADSEYFKQVTVKRKSHFLWKERTNSTNLRCAAECVSDRSCSAYVYQATAHTCQGYRSAIQHEIVQGTRAEDGYAVYYIQRHVREMTTDAPPVTETHGTADVREAKRGARPVTQTRRTAERDGDKGKQCKYIHDCHMSNSVCNHGNCKCRKGYVINRSKSSCNKRGVAGARGTKKRSSSNKPRGYPGTRGKRPSPYHRRGYTGTRGKGPSPFDPRGYPAAGEIEKMGSSFLSGSPYPGAGGTERFGSSFPLGRYPGIGGFEQKCQLNRQCRVANSVCFKGRCKCVPGFSYSKPKRSCVRICQRYGLTASVYRELGIIGHNNKELKVRSYGDCMSRCASETSFLCRSFDFEPREGCKLSSDGYLDVKEKYRQTDARGWIFGTRNCAL